MTFMSWLINKGEKNIKLYAAKVQHKTQADKHLSGVATTCICGLVCGLDESGPGKPSWLKGHVTKHTRF